MGNQCGPGDEDDEDENWWEIGKTSWDSMTDCMRGVGKRSIWGLK